MSTSRRPWDQLTGLGSLPRESQQKPPQHFSANNNRHNTTEWEMQKWYHGIYLLIYFMMYVALSIYLCTKYVLLCKNGTVRHAQEGMFNHYYHYYSIQRKRRAQCKQTCHGNVGGNKMPGGRGSWSALLRIPWSTINRFSLSPLPLIAADCCWLLLTAAENRASSSLLK